ncbi:MAG TPA: LysM peptidoglycan-binding domain-containing protein [Bacillota bacterium]
MSVHDGSRRGPRVNLSYRTERRPGAVGGVALPSRYRGAPSRGGSRAEEVDEQPARPGENGGVLEAGEAEPVLPAEPPAATAGGGGMAPARVERPAAVTKPTAGGWIGALQLPPQQAVGCLLATYVVRPGDSLFGVARRFNIPAARLRSANEPFVVDDLIFAGQILRVPLREPTLPFKPEALAYFVAGPGDSLASVADRFDLPQSAVAAVNPGLQDLRDGTVVLVPAVVESADLPLPPQLYVVRQGDTLAEIADSFAVDLDRLRAVNHGVVGDQIFAGQVLVIPLEGRPVNGGLRRARYVIQPGDTLASIARLFGTSLSLLEQANVFLSPVPGLVIAVPQQVPIPETPRAPEGFPSCVMPPFGERLDLGDDDSVFVPFPEGLDFRFFGEPAGDGVFVNANGNLTFGAGDFTFIPTTDAFLDGPPRIAGLWSDLLPVPDVTPGGVFVRTIEDEALGGPRLVVTWDRVPYFFAQDVPQTFQISLNPDDTISVCYFQVDAVAPEGQRILVGVGGGAANPRGNVFLFNGDTNPRRLGPDGEPTPPDGLSGRTLLYTFDPDLGNYRLMFSSP